MKQLIQNKKALVSYETLESFEAGIVLHGFEVTALRHGSGSLRGAYVIIDKNGEAILKNCNIPPLQPNNTPKSYDPERERRLLMQKNQLQKLIGQTSTKGLTLVPLSLYSNGRFIKVKIALARNKNKRDKRQDIKTRDTNREIARTLKDYR